MNTTTVQVRDIPEDVVAILKARAEQRGQSLAAYLRDLLTAEAAQPSIDRSWRPSPVARRSTTAATTFGR